MSDSENSSTLSVYGFNTWKVLGAYFSCILALMVLVILVKGASPKGLIVLLVYMAIVAHATAAARNRTVMLDQHFLLYRPAYGDDQWIWWAEVEKVEPARVALVNGSVPGLKFTMKTGAEIGVPLDLQERPAILEYVKQRLGTRALF